jgi:lipopolysaccharide export system permease protein
MTILDRYVIRSILGAVALVLAVLLVLGSLLLFIGEQSDIGIGHYFALDALWFVLLSLPQYAWEVLPIAALIGSLIGLGALARGSELTVMRATGISVARLAGAGLAAALILIAFEVALGEFLGPPLQQIAKQNKAFSKFTDMSFSGGGGAWVRDGNLILNVTRQSVGRHFGAMQVFEFSNDHRLLAIGHAARATAGSKRTWLLSDYAESRFTPQQVLARPGGERTLQSTVSAAFLGLAVEEPNELQISALWRLIGYFKANSLDAGPYVFAFWSRIARTVAIIFAVLLGIPFVLGSLRSAGAGARTLVGLMIGVGFFLLQRLIESGTIVFQLNPVVLAWLPTTLLTIVSVGLLVRAR